MATPDLFETMAGLASQAIEVQRLFDRQFDDESDTFRVLLAAATDDTREMLRPLMPERMLIRRFDVSLSLSLTTAHDTGFQLQAFPINANYASRHSLSAARLNMMRMSIDQVPLSRPTP